MGKERDQSGWSGFGGGRWQPDRPDWCVENERDRSWVMDDEIETTRSVMGNEIETTRSIKRRQASGGDMIEMTRVRSRGRRQRASGGGRLQAAVGFNRR